MPRFQKEQVLDLWFPDSNHQSTPESHGEFWDTRMQGGMDEIICRDFAELTRAAAAGELDEWRREPYGRLALLIALDQFPRSLWRNTPAAFGQDIKSARLCLEGIENGHYAALSHPWERTFYLIALGHCEGPDHLARMDLVVDLSKGIAEEYRSILPDMAELVIQQNERVRAIIERFGRHPHRNPIYGRVSSAEETAYIEKGEFPHLRSTDQMA